MTKAEVIKEITLKTGCDAQEVSTVVESIFSVIKDSMENGNDIFIRGFGTFLNKKRAKKIGRDISKNIAVEIPEHYKPAFRPSPEFKEMVMNSKKIKKMK